MRHRIPVGVDFRRRPANEAPPALQKSASVLISDTRVNRNSLCHRSRLSFLLWATDSSVAARENVRSVMSSESSTPRIRHPRSGKDD